MKKQFLLITLIANSSLFSPNMVPGFSDAVTSPSATGPNVQAMGNLPGQVESPRASNYIPTDQITTTQAVYYERDAQGNNGCFNCIDITAGIDATLACCAIGCDMAAKLAGSCLECTECLGKAACCCCALLTN